MSNDKGNDNQRRFSRVPFDTKTLLSTNQQCLQCQLIDISIKGALIKPPEGTHFEIGQPTQLEVSLDLSGVVIIMDMHVAHITGKHIGLACGKIDAESISHLRRLVELNLGDAELINRELLQLGK